MSHETKEIKSTYSIDIPALLSLIKKTSSLTSVGLFIGVSDLVLPSISSEANSPAEVEAAASKAFEQLQQAIPVYAMLQEKGYLKVMNTPEFKRALHDNIEHLKRAEVVEVFREFLNITSVYLTNETNTYPTILSLIRNADYLIEFNRFMTHVVINQVVINDVRQGIASTSKLFFEGARNLDFLRLHQAKFKNTLMTLKSFGLLKAINIINVLNKNQYLEKLDHIFIWAKENQILSQASQTHNQAVFQNLISCDCLFTIPLEEWDKIILLMRKYHLLHPQNFVSLFGTKPINFSFLTFALPWVNRYFPFSSGDHGNDIFWAICCFANAENPTEPIAQLKLKESFEQAASLLQAADLFNLDNFARLLKCGNIPLIKVFLKELVENKYWDWQKKQAIFTAFTQCDYEEITPETQADIASAFDAIMKDMHQIGLYSSENIAALFKGAENIIYVTEISTWLRWAIAENFFDGQPGDQELLVSIIENGSTLYNMPESDIANFKTMIMHMKSRGLLQGNKKHANLLTVFKSSSFNCDSNESELVEPINILLSQNRYRKRQLSLVHEYGLKDLADPALAIKMVNATQADFDCIMQYGSEYSLNIAKVLEALEKLEPPIYAFHPNSAFGKALAINPADADGILTLWLKILCQPPFALMSIEQARAGITNPLPDLVSDADSESVPCIWQKTLLEGYNYSALGYLITTAINVGFVDKEEEGNKKIKFADRSQKDKAQFFIFFAAISSTELAKALSSVLGKQPGREGLEDFKKVLSLARYKNLLAATWHIVKEPIPDIRANYLELLFQQGESELTEGHLPSPSNASERMLKEGFYDYIVQALSQHHTLSTKGTADSKDTVRAILLDLQIDPKKVTQLPPAKIPLSQLNRSFGLRERGTDLRWSFQDMLNLFRTDKNHRLLSRLPENIGHHIAGFLMKEPTLSFTWQFLKKPRDNRDPRIVGDEKRTASASNQEPVTENPAAASDATRSPAHKKLGIGPQ